MHESVVRVTLVGTDPRSRDGLRALIRGMDWVLLDTECPRFEAAAATVAQTKPDGVVVLLDDDPARALDLINQLAILHPRLPLIVVSGRTDLLVKAYRAGAKSLLDHPVQLEELSVALRNLFAGISLQRPAQGQIIALLGSRGGVGCTSLAVNLGCTLAQDTDNRVVLIDLDLTLGNADVALDLNPQYRLTDVVVNVEQIDHQILKQSLTADKTGLFLLPRPSRFQDAVLVKAEHVGRLLTLLRITTSHLIVDLSKSWSVVDLKAMQMAHMILLVAQPEIGSLRNTVSLLASLSGEGLAGKVQIVMNRTDADFGEDAISLAKAEDVIGLPVAWQVPNDPKAMMKAWNTGIPLVRSGPRSKAQQSITALAEDGCSRGHRRGNAGPPRMPGKT